MLVTQIFEEKWILPISLFPFHKCSFYFYRCRFFLIIQDSWRCETAINYIHRIRSITCAMRVWGGINNISKNKLCFYLLYYYLWKRERKDRIFNIYHYLSSYYSVSSQLLYPEAYKVSLLCHPPPQIQLVNITLKLQTSMKKHQWENLRNYTCI